jgi:hypothetical protein
LRQDSFAGRGRFSLGTFFLGIFFLGIFSLKRLDASRRFQAFSKSNKPKKTMPIVIQNGFAVLRDTAKGIIAIRPKEAAIGGKTNASRVGLTQAATANDNVC